METLKSYNPATGEVVGEVPVTPASDIPAVVARARAAQPAWEELGLEGRVDLLRKTAEIFAERAEAHGELMTKEMGKPLKEGIGEAKSLAYIDHELDEIVATLQPEVVEDKRLRSTVYHDPLGVVGAITPWNFPMSMPAWMVLPALAAGNTVVFKPSEKTPAVGALLVECFHRAGIDKHVVQALIGGPDEGKALVAHPEVDGVLFTGSAQAGIAINRKCATNPGKILALEMGGNNPIVVMKTPKVEDAALLIARSAFTTAGQRCTAARRLIVTEDMYDETVQAVKDLIPKIIVDEPFADPAPFMGCVIDNQAADQLAESFLYLLSNGGKAIRHLKRPQEDKPFVTPALIDTTAMEERPDVELFGPLLQVIKVTDLDAAIAEANNTRFGLSASLIGGAPEDYNHFWANIRAGIVNWNQPTNGASSKQPFGGLGLSGNHRPAAYYAADYCAYPVASSEIGQPRASMGVGFKTD